MVGASPLVGGAGFWDGWLQGLLFPDAGEQDQVPWQLFWDWSHLLVGVAKSLVPVFSVWVIPWLLLACCWAGPVSGVAG